jgi:hypothetical protein
LPEEEVAFHDAAFAEGLELIGELADFLFAKELASGMAGISRARPSQ